MITTITTKQINEIQGSASNFENFNLDYSVIEGEELVLAPTFKFTIDSITPDVRYEWYVDKSCKQVKLVPLIHLKPKRVGTYQVTFAVTDNKSGVQFGKSTTIKSAIYLSAGLGDFVR